MKVRAKKLSAVELGEWVVKNTPLETEAREVFQRVRECKHVKQHYHF
jgi:hypothetical protein